MKDLLDTHGIRSERLGLELPESQTMTLESQRAALQELTALGVGLAMDDLGSGRPCPLVGLVHGFRPVGGRRSAGRDGDV